MEQRWVEVSIDTQVDSLLEAVKHSSKLDHVVSASGTHRTMVFANTIEAAEAVAKILQQFDIECLCYHSDSTLEERKKKLVSFSENGGVLVCTDAAARGLDIPNVSHVIQVKSDSLNCLCPLHFLLAIILKFVFFHRLNSQHLL